MYSCLTCIVLLLRDANLLSLEEISLVCWTIFSIAHGDKISIDNLWKGHSKCCYSLPHHNTPYLEFRTCSTRMSLYCSPMCWNTLQRLSLHECPCTAPQCDDTLYNGCHCTNVLVLLPNVLIHSTTAVTARMSLYCSPMWRYTLQRLSLLSKWNLNSTIRHIGQVLYIESQISSVPY